MEFDHYDYVPALQADKIIAAAKAAKTGAKKRKSRGRVDIDSSDSRRAFLRFLAGSPALLHAEAGRRSHRGPTPSTRAITPRSPARMPRTRAAMSGSGGWLREDINSP